MTQQSMTDLSVSDLVDRFTSLTLAQHETLLLIQNAKFTRLMFLVKEVLDELKSRKNDQRRALLPLLQSNNLWLKYRAAHAVLALEPELARVTIEAVQDSKVQPEAAEAGMTIYALDYGIFVPK